jgi:hypothetical protein
MTMADIAEAKEEGQHLIISWGISLTLILLLVAAIAYGDFRYSKLQDQITSCQTSIQLYQQQNGAPHVKR